MGNDSVSPIGASKTYKLNYRDYFKDFKERLLGGKNGQQDTTSFLASTSISVADFSRTGTVHNWNVGNVQMTGNNITS